MIYRCNYMSWNFEIALKITFTKTTCCIRRLSHSTPSTASLGQRDLILWSAHGTTQTWVYYFSDQTRHNSACHVTVIFRWRALFNCDREKSIWSHDFLNGVSLWFCCLHFSSLPILLILSSFFPCHNNLRKTASQNHRSSCQGDFDRFKWRKWGLFTQ